MKTKRFVTFTKDMFENWCKEHLPEHTYIVKGKELVAVVPLPTLTDELHIYSSVSNDGSKSRGVGEDAIRLVLHDTKCDRYYATTRIYRVESDKSTLWERLELGIKKVIEKAATIDRCYSCGSPRVKKKNRTTGETFVGCLAVCHKNKPTDTETEHRVHEPVKPKSGLIPVEKSEIITELVPDDEVVSVDKYPYIKYAFPTFNRVQSTLFNVGYKKDANFVLGTTTSSGKTVCAELFIGETLHRKKKVIYMSPLKSLTQEKFDDWTKKFPDKKIAILTGDYVLKPSKAKELFSADIICMTSEMLDSRSRKADCEKSSWLFDIDLIVVDETHIIGTERGHAVEVGLMRAAQLIPSARIVCLSATLINIEDFVNWLTVLNGKPTIAINSNWRPVKLIWNYIYYESKQSYWQKKEEIKNIAVEIIESKPDQKFLCFVHDKKSGAALLKTLQDMKIKAKFHSADLDLQTRISIEKSFESRDSKSLRVLVSTSTLAWGRSLPARNVIILDVKRGMTEVDILDIVQMGGRAGRLGIDPDGTVFLICPHPRAWREKVEQQRPIKSTLLDKDILGFHIVAEIRINTIKNKTDINAWYTRSLAYIQEFKEDYCVEDALERLFNVKALEEEEGKYKLTFLGNLSAMMYYLPKDIFHLYCAGNMIDNNNDWNNTLLLANLAGGLPSRQLPYVPSELSDITEDYNRAMNMLGAKSSYQSALAAALWSYLEGSEPHPMVRSFLNDADRITEVVQMISQGVKWKATRLKIKLAGLQLKYGVSSNVVHFCLLPGIGRVKAEHLGLMNFNSLKDINSSNRELIVAAVGPKTADTIIEYVQEVVQKKKNKKRGKK